VICGFANSSAARLTPNIWAIPLRVSPFLTTYVNIVRFLRSCFARHPYGAAAGGGWGPALLTEIPVPH